MSVWYILRVVLILATIYRGQDNSSVSVDNGKKLAYHWLNKRAAQQFPDWP
jgi:hypothetical protein